MHDLLLCIPLALILVFFSYTILTIRRDSLSFVQRDDYMTQLAVLIVCVFSAMYIIATLNKKVIPQIAKYVAYFLSTAIVLALVILARGLYQDAINETCTGFFGVQEACIDGKRFVLGLTIFNPIIYFVYMVFAAWGVFALSKSFKR